MPPCTAAEFIMTLLKEEEPLILIDQWIFPVTSWPVFNEVSEGVENVLCAPESCQTNKDCSLLRLFIIYCVSVV